MNFSIILLAIAIAIELVWLGGIDRHADPYSVTIESTELSYNPWPAPGDQTEVAGERTRTPSNPRILPHDGPAAASRDRR